jgi:hypothetical protein
LTFRLRLSNETTPRLSRRRAAETAVNYATESDEHWLRTKRSLYWTVVLLAVLGAILVSVS